MAGVGAISLPLANEYFNEVAYLGVLFAAGGLAAARRLGHAFTPSSRA